MLSFLLLASSSGQPLPADAVARCSRLPARDLTFVPTAATTWRSDDGHVVLVAWADGPQLWHTGEHGCTLTTTAPWPLASRFNAPSGVAFELTDRLGDGDDPGVLSWLAGSSTIVRTRPDGTGLVGAPPAGGGAVHLADGDGLVAISDRATIAAMGAGGGARRTDLPDLVRGWLSGDRAAVTGVRRLRPGEYVTLKGREGATVVNGPTPWTDDPSATTAELVADAADDLTRLVELAADQPGARVLELGADPGSLVIAAAVAATGSAGRFTVRASGPGAATTAAAALADALGVPVTPAPVLHGGGEALDARLRASVNRIEGAMAPWPGRTGRLSGAGETGLVLAATPGGALSPDAGPSGRRLLTSQAWAELEAEDRRWRDERGGADRGPAVRALLEELDRRSGRRQRAAADLAAPAVLLDPLAIPSVARAALAAAAADHDVTAMLVEALHPPMQQARTAGGEEPSLPGGTGWRTMAPVVEAHVLGHARELLGDVLDLDEVAMVVRAGTVPDDDTLRAMEGALALAVWAAETDVHAPAAPAPVELRTDVDPPDQPPTLITGVTSRSLLELTDLPVSLDVTEVDALLAVRVDREVRDLCLRILLAVGATPGQLPMDLDERLSGPATAHLAAPARALLARRGGALADPRLALTLPFWRAHVAAPRVVLVAERPPDLAVRSASGLPVRELLGWWVDAMTCAAGAGVPMRIVDPHDLVDMGEEEATGWDGLDEGSGDVADLIRVVRTVDSLVREVELEAARPLLRTIRQARAVEPVVDSPRRTAPAAAPLHVVDELWERAVEADRRLSEERAATVDLQGRLAELEAEVGELRNRRGLKAAWQLLRGNPG